jgi:DNA-binding CsgD family transcriptional regulator
MRQDIRFCKAADGVRLAYATSGDGPPLVMAATWLTHLEHQWRSLLLASLIPDRRFVQLDSQNHMPLLDEPAWARLVAEIRSFLATQHASTPRRNALPLDDLTPRERAILEGIADGLDNSEIASALGLSEKTVRNHITRVFDKIQVQHRYQAIVRARDAGLGTRAAAR